MGMKVYEAETLLSTLEERTKKYEALKDQFQRLKKTFTNIAENDHFQGRGAKAIKSFYQAQADVADAWLLFIERNIAFFRGVSGMVEDAHLGEDTVVHIPFLEEDLDRLNWMAKENIYQQQAALRSIFSEIDDLVPLQAFSTNKVMQHLNDADEERRETIARVEELDRQLSLEYAESEYEEGYVYTLFRQLIDATKKGENITPLHFNAHAFYNSKVYQLKTEMVQRTNEYVTFKKELLEQRELAKEIEAQENRPWYEKTWDGIVTFSGEFFGYYDSKRALEGIDPVTGRKLTEAERITAGAMAAAGFIPLFGWAGRAFSGGKAVYKTIQGADAASSALKAYNTSKSIKYLQMSEMGIYGLLSFNGLRDAVTGKDMFGNELTEEQRRQSMIEALSMIGLGGAAIGVDRALRKKINGNDINKIVKFSEVPKASELRYWAEQQGYEMLSNQNGIEVWGVKGSDGWRLKIKQPSSMPGIHPDSMKPRYSARIELGVYFDPVTGRTGTRKELGHLDLDFD
ncbi:ribonuclease YeeF family protein [Bacillaceae bacterium Marseille-Q3522]|nr:ribonuclease YeeF family protein [Bacillaceae bacterium Marseille-Q3522]